MANVSFNRGTQAALVNVTAVDGAFYLTTDTHRLYIGGANGALNEVNQGVQFVEYMNAEAATNAGHSEASVLPTSGQIPGQFYYVTNGNILCVYNGTQWVQVNPDTNTTYTFGESNGQIVITGGGTTFTTTVIPTAESIASAISPMKYKGTVASNEVSTKLLGYSSWGEVYMASDALTLAQDISVGKPSGGTTAKIGDLVVAQPYNPAVSTTTQQNPNTVWAVIPSGDETPVAALTWGTFGS